MAFINPSFELPDATATPGEALGWTWTSVSAGETWAAFNAADPAWLDSIEDFGACFGLMWDVTYADEAARLAAGPFVAADAGLVARQTDTKAIWILSSAVPVAWTELTTGIEDWIDELTDPPRTVAFFNGSSSYEASIELFELWDGPPWLLDALPPRDQQEFGVGWRGTADTALLGGRVIPSTPQYPEAVETFASGWNLDPLAPVGTTFCAGDGMLRGQALSFPLAVPPNQRTLWVWLQGADGLIEVALTPGTYATATALAAEVQAKWAAACGAVLTTLEWRAWSADGATGLEFGWDGTRGLDRATLVVPLHRRSRDARARLGMRAFGPTQGDGFVVMPYAAFGGAGDYYAAFDPYATVDVRAVDCLEDDGYYLIIGGGVPATFSAFDPGATPVRMERFELVPWRGPTATWVSDLLAVTRVDAVLQLGTTSTTTIELFAQAAEGWPDFYEE
jgi:hypothetical protein